jgi:hypothetical protein
VEVNGVAGRERAGDVGAGALVGQDPEVELGEEPGEVGEGGVGWGREGLDPEGRAYLDWVLLQECVWVLALETLVWWWWWWVVGGEGRDTARGREGFGEAVEVFDGCSQRHFSFVFFVSVWLMNDYERERIPSGLGLDMHALASKCQQTLGGRFDWNEKDGGFCVWGRRW